MISPPPPPHISGLRSPGADDAEEEDEDEEEEEGEVNEGEKGAVKVDSEECAGEQEKKAEVDDRQVTKHPYKSCTLTLIWSWLCLKTEKETSVLKNNMQREML